MALEGQGILQNGKPALEFSGFSVLSLGKEFAVLRNPQGDQFSVELDSLQAVQEGRPISRTGEEYRPELFRSRRLASTETREIWGIDENERDWAAQNSQLILERDVQISPCTGGGLRLEALSSHSMPAARGLKGGDVLREVNGRSLSSLADLQAILSNPPKSGIELTLERAGKSVVFEYRPLPR
jgi:hypothetical protein